MTPQPELPSKLRVLFVEHTAGDVELAIAELRRSGFEAEVTVVSNAADFLARLAGETYDIVLADYRLPGWTGLEALKAMQDAGHDVPLILVTGTLGEEAAVESIKLGVSDYVLKDNMQRLSMVVRRALEERALREHSRESEERYRSLVENATYGIYRVTPEGVFLDVNGALAHMLGYGSTEELMALNIGDAVFRNPADRDMMQAMYLRDGRVSGMEVEWKRKDSRTILVSLSGRAVKNPDGSIREAEVIAEDITERRAMENQLRAAQKYEAIGQLAGGVAHDFNNVIGAVMGWAELALEDTPKDARIYGHLVKIRDQAERAAGLTRQLLAFARRQVLEQRNVDLNGVVRDVLSLLEKVIGKDIEIRTALAADLEPTRADSTQLEQVLMNLCLNARDAMPRGGAMTIETCNTEIDDIYCRRYPFARPGHYAMLSVTDSGEGMDPSTLEHIFEPFFTTKQVGKGTGLGLATVYGIVKQHGGFINVYSEPGHGTTFKVYLHAAAGAVDKLEPRVAEPVRGGTETILVAEDHEGVRAMAQEMLSRFGYQVVLVNNGEEALRVFREREHPVGPVGGNSPIDLVLLDVIMPRLSGPEAYSQMSALRPGLPVIFVTGYSAESAPLLRDLAARGVPIVQKPYNPTQLARRIREALDRPAKR